MDLSERVKGALSRAAVRTQQRNEGPPRTTREEMVEWARANLRGRELVVVSNREPYSHEKSGEGIRWIRKDRRPDLQLALFWHIPWPNYEVFRILPWRREILEGMLANDLVGFHIRSHALNFLDSVAATLEARVDREQLAVERGGKRTW